MDVEDSSMLAGELCMGVVLILAAMDALEELVVDMDVEAMAVVVAEVLAAVAAEAAMVVEVAAEEAAAAVAEVAVILFLFLGGGCGKFLSLLSFQSKDLIIRRRMWWMISPIDYNLKLKIRKLDINMSI